MATRRQLANAIRALSMDAVQKAKSGHPGAPMDIPALNYQIIFASHQVISVLQPLICRLG